MFGVTAGLVPRTRWLLGSLAPAFACALITLSIYNNGNNLHRSAKTAVILIPGQQDQLAYTPDASRMRENNWLAVTFDWTNHSSFTSSIPSFPRNSMN